MESGGAEKSTLWIADLDYDGRSLFDRRVFVPKVGPRENWARLAREFKAESDVNWSRRIAAQEVFHSRQETMLGLRCRFWMTEVSRA